MVADKRGRENLPFSALNREELRDTLVAAEKSLSKQRAGMEISDTDEVLDAGIRLAPKKSGQTTVGQPWNGGAEPSKSGRGLVARMSGWMYVCEYDSCAENWRTEVVPQEQMGLLIELYKLHISQCHERKS